MNWKKIAIHLFLWIGFVGIMVLIFFLQHGRIHFSLFDKLLFGICIFYFNYSLLIPLFLFQKKAVAYIIFSVLFIAFIIIIPAALDNREFLRHFSRMRFIFRIFMYLFFFVAAIALRSYEKWLQNEKQEQEIKAERAKTELHYLKNQINPHFLFNSLNNIYALTVKKSDKTSEAIIRLSELMRYMLYQSDSKYTDLTREIAYIEDYIALQRLRITEPKSIEFKVSGKPEGKKISPLLLIAFIENAFKFGTAASLQNPIKIVLKVTEQNVHFYCENPVVQYTKVDKDNGIGLENVRERLRLLYPNQHRLSIYEKDNKYCVTLTLEYPKMKS